MLKHNCLAMMTNQFIVLLYLAKNNTFYIRIDMQLYRKVKHIYTHIVYANPLKYNRLHLHCVCARSEYVCIDTNHIACHKILSCKLNYENFMPEFHEYRSSHCCNWWCYCCCCYKNNEWKCYLEFEFLK